MRVSFSLLSFFLSFSFPTIPSSTIVPSIRFSSRLKSAVVQHISFSRGDVRLMMIGPSMPFFFLFPNFKGCSKCADVGSSVCNVWFFNGDDQGGRCIFKLDATNDTVTKPTPNFYAGRLHQSKRPHPNNDWCSTISWPFGGSCSAGCPCPARVTIGKGVGWETGWMTYKEKWTRLIALTRWLGAAHHVEAQPLYGEDLVSTHSINSPPKIEVAALLIYADVRSNTCLRLHLHFIL